MTGEPLGSQAERYAQESNRIRNVLRQCMSEHPLYSPDQEFAVKRLDSGAWYIGWADTPGLTGPQRGETSHFHTNKDGDTLYLLGIRLREHLRGQGLGAKLYTVVEALAKGLNCVKVQMTPVGRTGRGKSRMDYILRRGYSKVGEEAVKHVQPAGYKPRIPGDVSCVDHS